MARIFEARDDVAEALRLYEEALAIESSVDLTRRRDALRERIELAKLARRVPGHPGRAAGHARRSGGAHRRPPRAGARPVARRGRRHGSAQPLGRHLDHDGGARGRRCRPSRITRSSRARSSIAPSWRRPSRGCLRTSRRKSVSATGAPPAIRFADVPTGHLAYQPASVAVASGVLEKNADESFQPSRRVTGAEAVQTVERLRAMTSLGAGSPARR